MSGRVIFLLEEPSMKAMLAEYLPRLVPGWIQGQHFLLLPHQGKSDLDKSIPVPDPDECQKPSHELERNIKDFQKNEGARRLGRLLDADRATSRSLKVFAQGVRMLAERA